MRMQWCMLYPRSVHEPPLNRKQIGSKGDPIQEGSETNVPSPYCPYYSESLISTYMETGNINWSTYNL